MQGADAILLDEVFANAWPAPLTQVLARWQLRVGGRPDRRTNSVWSIGESELDLDEAVGIAEDFYRRRGRRTEFRCGGSTPPALVELLRARGYEEASSHPLAAVAETATVTPRAVEGFELLREHTISEEWFDIYWSAEEVRAGGQPEAAAEARTTVLSPGPEAIFVSARREGSVVSVGQGVIDRGWLTIQCIGTRHDSRRVGGATAVLGELIAIARERSLDHLCLAVQEANTGARPLYESIGFRIDHRCTYLGAMR